MKLNLKPTLQSELQSMQLSLIITKSATPPRRAGSPALRGSLLPSHVGSYDLGLFQTKAGPLYVNPGIGTFYLSVRTWCRPKVTIIEF